MKDKPYWIKYQFVIGNFKSRVHTDRFKKKDGATQSLMSKAEKGYITVIDTNIKEGERCQQI